MRAVLIDPFTRTITEVDYNGDIRHIYQLCGFEGFESMQLDGGWGEPSDRLFVDEYGATKAGQARFSVPVRGHPLELCGRALLLRNTATGETRSPKRTLAQVRKMVTWLEPSEFTKADGWAVFNHPN